MCALVGYPVSMDSDTHTMLDLAVAQAKRVERELRTLKQQLAQLRDHLQPEEAQDERDQ